MGPTLNGEDKVSPPATSTSPPGRSVAVCCSRARCIAPVFAHLPVLGLYSSAPLVSLHAVSSQELNPPVTSTSPLRSSVAVWYWRPACMLPVRAHVPVAGLYSSALARLFRKLPLSQNP